MKGINAMENKVDISIIIPTYKRADMICNAVDSVLNQTYRDLEVIVVDDNDPSWPERAQTEKAMGKYVNESRVIYIKHLLNKNGSAARNTGIRASRGRYISFLDDDDTFFPKKVEAVVECLDSKDDSWGACYCNYTKVLNGKVVSNRVKGYEGNLYEQALARNLYIIPGSNLTVRKSVAAEVGGFDESFQRNQDLEFLVKILKKYKLAYAPVMGTNCLIHTDPNRKVVDGLTLKKNYLEKFGYLIEELPEEKKKEVYKHIDLQTFRQLISNGDRREALSLIGDNMSIFDVADYYLYLFIRKVKKSSYGFHCKSV